MAGTEYRLAFERPIYELEDRLVKLDGKSEQTPEVRDEIRRLRRERVDLIKHIYNNLKPWEQVEVARHPERPDDHGLSRSECSMNSWNCTATSVSATIALFGPVLPSSTHSK